MYFRYLHCSQNAENEIYYPSLFNLKMPSGANPINAQGLVQVIKMTIKQLNPFLNAEGRSDAQISSSYTSSLIEKID